MLGIKRKKRSFTKKEERRAPDSGFAVARLMTYMAQVGTRHSANRRPHIPDFSTRSLHANVKGRGMTTSSKFFKKANELGHLVKCSDLKTVCWPMGANWDALLETGLLSSRTRGGSGHRSLATE